MNLGEYIANVIDEQGKTKTWVADQSNINYKTFVDKVTRDSFTGKELLRISIILNINLENLKDIERRENMKKIKVYDIKKLIEDIEFSEERKYLVRDYSSGMAIIEGTKGVLVFDDEGCGFKKDNLDGEIEIGLNVPKTDGSFSAMAEYTIRPTVESFMKAEFKEILITDFIERRNKTRIKENLKSILKTIDEIGLDSREYYIEELKGEI